MPSESETDLPPTWDKKKNKFSSQPKYFLHTQGMESRTANTPKLVYLYCSHASSIPDLIPGTEHSFVPSPFPHSSNPEEGKNIKELHNSSEKTAEI